VDGVEFLGFGGGALWKARGAQFSILFKVNTDTTIPVRYLSFNDRITALAPTLSWILAA
jgi:hypothetical protein